MRSVQFKLGSFSPAIISGWAYDEASVEESIVISLYIDDVFIRNVPCNLPRSNIASLSMRRAKVGFATSLPLKYWDGDRHRVVFKDDIAGLVLSDKLLKTENVIIESGEAGTTYGKLAVVDGCRVSGWVIRGEKPIRASIYIDDVLVDTVLADSPETIDAEYQCGLHFDIPHIWCDGVSHSIKVYLMEDGVEKEIFSEVRVLARVASDNLEVRLSFPAPLRMRATLIGDISVRREHLHILNKSIQIGRVGVEEVDNAPPYADFDIGRLPPIDWVNSELSFKLGDRLVRLAHAEGGHPVRDQVRVRMEKHGASVRIDAPVPLAVHTVGLLSGGRPVSGAIVQADEGNPGSLHLQHPMLRSDTTGRLTLSIAGREYEIQSAEVHDSDPPIMERLPLPARVELSRYVPANSVQVRRALASGVQRPADPGIHTGEFAGEWWFSSPTQISGWAVSLAAPDQALAAELLSSGEAVAAVVANASVRLSDLGIARALPIGFSFDLRRLAPGPTQIAVRIGRSAMLPPAEGVSIDIPSQAHPGVEVEAIDRLVQRGDVIAAYLKSGEACTRHSLDVAARRLVLGSALRFGPLDQTSPPPTEGEADLATLFKLLSAHDASSPNSAADSELFSQEDQIREELQRLNLPSIYLPLALKPREDNVFERVLRSHLLSSERFLDSDSQCPLRSIHILCAPLLSPSAAFLTHLAELESRGCQVTRLEQPLADFSERPPAAPTGGRRRRRGVEREQNGSHAAEQSLLVIYLGAERILSFHTLPYWHQAIVNSGGNAELTKVLSSPECSEQEARLLPRQVDNDVHLWFRPSDVSEFASVRASERILERAVVELTTFAPMARVGAPCHYVIAGGGDARAGLAVPRDVEIVELPAPSPDSEERAWLTVELLDQLRERAASPDPAVIVLSPELGYGRSYVDDCLRERAIESGSSIVSAAFEYNTEREDFFVSADSQSTSSYLGLMCLGCYSLGELREFVSSWGVASVSSLLLASKAPFKVAILGDSTEHARNDESLRAMLRDAKKSEEARHLGFLAHALMRVGDRLSQNGGKTDTSLLDRQERASWRLLQRKEEIAAADSMKGLAVLASQLASAGFDLEAANLIRERLAHAVSTRKGAEADYLELLQAAKSLGLLGEVGLAFSDRTPSLVTTFPGLITPLFEALALALPPEDFSAVLVASTAAALQGSATRPIFRLVELARRYSSALTMVTVLAMIARSQHVEMLKSKAIQAAAGHSFVVNGFSADVEFPEAGLSTRAMRDAAPLRLQAVAALEADDPRRFTAVLRRALLSETEVAELLSVLRIYSYELSLFTRRHGVALPSGSVAESSMILGILLEDDRFIKYLLGRDGAGSGDALSIVASTYTGDYTLLNKAYARWADEVAMQPVSFGGTSIVEMFEGLANQSLTASTASSLGKVSVIMTVYNPDMTLMRLAVQSVINQTYRDLELIIVDDASDEVGGDFNETLGVIDDRIRFLKMPRNSGPYVCRNAALELAEGEFIAIQDADDFSHPQRIEAQVRQLSERSTRMMCTTEHMRIDFLGRLQFEHTFHIRGDGPMTTLFRRACFNVLGPFASVRSRGDVEFRERVKAAFGRHAHVNVRFPMVFCYAAPSSLSNSTMRNAQDFLRLFRESFDKRIVLPVIDGVYSGQRPTVVEVPFILRP